MEYKHYWRRRGNSMEIRELQIKNFGKFTNETIDFHSGINIIYGANEMGKTTMHSFIKGMFFGIDKLRGRASKNDEYSLREPWENASHYAGILRFESGGKRFRLERDFNKKNKSVQLVCESDGEELSVQQGDLEILMAGMNETAFQNTVFFQQKGSRTDEGLAKELQNYMSNMQNAGGSEIDVSGAISQLNEKRKKLIAQKKQKSIKMQGHRQEVQMKLDYVQQEIDHVRQEKQECSFRLSNALEKKQEFRKSLNSQKSEHQKSENQKLNSQKPENQIGGKLIEQFILWALGAVVLLICIFTPNILIKLLSLLTWIIVFGCFFWKQKKSEQQLKELMANRQAPVKEDMEQREAEELEETIKKLQWKLEHVAENLKEKRTVQNNLKETLEEIQEEFAGTDKLVREQEAVCLAITTLQDISDEIYNETAWKLNRRISEILSEITEGQYTNVYLDANMEVRINTPNKLLSLEQVSYGTMEQIYFALRMAAAELLSGQESMPIILDDAFAMYDDKRLQRTLNWLHRSGRQVILFTCHKREEEYLTMFF